MAGINDNVGPQEEMNLLAEADIKVEDVDIKVEVHDWPWAWIDDLEPNPQQMPRVPEAQACPAQMNPPPVPEVEDIPPQIHLPPVQVNPPQIELPELEMNPPPVPEVEDIPPQLNPHLMHEPHVELPEPTVDLRLDYVVCSCLVKNSIFTRSKARKHKEMCYEIWN